MIQPFPELLLKECSVKQMQITMASLHFRNGLHGLVQHLLLLTS